MDLTTKESARFIELVAENPSLYNPRDMSYKDQLLRESVWESIAQSMNRDPEPCKRHWRNLKDAYGRFRRRFKETGQIDKRSNWHVYKLMSFLDDMETGRSNKVVFKSFLPSKPKEKRVSNNPIVVGIEHVVFDKPLQIERHAMISLAESECSPTIEGSPSSSIVLNDEPKNIDEPTPAILASDDSDHTEQPTTAKRRRTRRRKTSSTDKKVQNTQKHVVTKINNVANTTANTDSVSNNVVQIIQNNTSSEDDAAIMSFLMHLKDVIMKLPPLLQIQAKQEMFRVITKYEVMALSDENTPDGLVNNLRDDSKKQTEIDISSVFPYVDIKIETMDPDKIVEVKEEPLN